MASNEEIPPDLFGPMTFSMEIPSLFKATATETGQPPMTSNFLNGGNQAIGVKPNSLKLKRYADIIKSDTCHKQETASVSEPTLPQGFALNSTDTVSATDEHDPVGKGCTDNVENSSSDNLKLEGSSDLDENVGLLPPILSQSSEAEKNQSPLKPRPWFEDSSEMFDAIDSSFTSSEDCSNNSSLNESADISSSYKSSGDSSFTTSPETKKAGFLRRLGARLLRKHKKKRTTSDELNESQQSTDTSSTSDDTFSTTCENKPSNQSLFEQSEATLTANDLLKSVSSSNDNSPTAIKSDDQKKESVQEEARLPIEAISPAGKRDHVRAEKRLRKYFASKKLTMPGSTVPKNRICWRNPNGASNTSPTGSKKPPNGVGTKKFPYCPKLAEDDRTKQSIEKYWNYRIALFTKMTSSSLKCLPEEEEDIPSNTPEIDYVELGLTGFVRNQFKKDTPNNPQSNNTSDTASGESTKISNTSSSFVGKTDPHDVVDEDFNNTSKTAADSSPLIPAGMATSSKPSLHISQLGPEEIGAAIIRIKAFLANKTLAGTDELAPTNDDVAVLRENNSQNELVTGNFTAPLSTITTSLFRDELSTEAPCLQGTSSPCRLDTSTSTADGLESPSRMTILSQISPSKFDGIEAARMQMKASLAAIGGLKRTVGSAENSNCNPTDNLPLFRNELNTSTLQTTPVKEDANTTKKQMKTSHVTNLKKKKEVFTPPRSRFSKYFTSTRKGYKLTSQLLKDVFQKKDQNEPMQISMPASSMQTPSHSVLLSNDGSHQTSSAEFQLSRVESSDHETPEKLQVPVEDIIKVHYTDDFKKRISTPTKFIASQIIEECEQSPYSSPMKPEPTPEPVRNVSNVISHPPSSVNWLEAQMANLFGRQISMATSVPVVTQIVAPVVKQIPVNLSHSICSDELTTALNEVWIKKNNEILSKQNASMTIKEPDSLKSCVANPDRLMDKVPEYFSPVKTPCQTPVKMQFDKRIRPTMCRFSHKDVLRVRPIKLPFPKRIKKSVSFLDDFKSVPTQPSFDEVVNGGGSGFRILSIEDHNANTVTFPKYVPPERFIPNSK